MHEVVQAAIRGQQIHSGAHVQQLHALPEEVPQLTGQLLDLGPALPALPALTVFQEGAIDAVQVQLSQPGCHHGRLPAEGVSGQQRVCWLQPRCPHHRVQDPSIVPALCRQEPRCPAW